MKTLAAALLACTLAVTSVAHAGGPVIVEDTTVEAETRRVYEVVRAAAGEFRVNLGEARP